MKPTEQNSLSELLSLYDNFVKEFIENNGKHFTIVIPLTANFLRECRDRIIENHKKYGEDWKEKDNLKEMQFEKYDIFNYYLLDKCQQEWKYK